MSRLSVKGELVSRENSASVGPLHFRFISSVSANAIAMKRNRTGRESDDILCPYEPRETDRVLILHCALRRRKVT